MKTFQKQAAQGDMLITRIEKLPEGVTFVNPENGKFVLAHSETGHNHSVLAQEGVKLYSNDNNPFIAYLVVENKITAFVEHERTFHTHETIAFVAPSGAPADGKQFYEIRRQREYTPEGFRRAQD